MQGSQALLIGSSSTDTPHQRPDLPTLQYHTRVQQWVGCVGSGYACVITDAATLARAPPRQPALIDHFSLFPTKRRSVHGQTILAGLRGGKSLAQKMRP